MFKEKMRALLGALVKHNKLIFPIVVIVAAAITVALALGVGKVEERLEDPTGSETVETGSSTEEVLGEEEIPEILLERSQDSELCSLIYTYFNALANGDIETIKGISNYVDETEAIWNLELSKYIESYPVIEVYTKAGPVEGSYIAYVYYHMTFYGQENNVPGMKTFYICRDENDKYYLNDGETAEDVLAYMETVSLQADVVDLINKANAEYNELLVNDSGFADYMTALENEVRQATGEALAALVTGTQPSEDSQGTGETGGEGSTGEEDETPQEPVVQGPQYATATTTVNVRGSDSVQADKLGQVSGGARIQVIEQQVNGWTKIVYEGKEGFIKSEFLQMEETDNEENNAEAIRTAKATTNVNLRKTASQSGEKLGVVAGGDSLEVLSESGEWTQVRYKGTVGYVKSEYIQ